MPNPQQNRVEYVEVIGSMEKGVNYGIAPNLIRNNQLSSAQNLTVRGDYITPRPAFQKIPITFVSGSDIVTGAFQGAAVYQPDFGNGSLMASISGRLFQFIISGNTATATEKTIAGNPNVSSPTQSWLWQSENFMVINDGVNLPIFFDGSNSRRSYGPPTPLGQVSVNFTAPLVNQSVNVTLLANYTGPQNITIAVDGFFYQVTSATATSTVLTNITDTPGTTITATNVIQSEPATWGVMTSNFHINAGSYPAGTTFPFTASAPGAKVGDVILVQNQGSGTIASVNGNSFTLKLFGNVLQNPTDMPKGTLVYYSNNSNPPVTVATVAANFIVPAQGSTVTIQTALPYSGPNGSLGYINNGQYRISIGPALPIQNTVSLTNITDVPGTVHGPTGAGGLGILTTVPELPAGRMGAYGLGRNWMALTDGRSYVASDIVGGSSGTPALKNRDAVLRITENAFLYQGGVFVIPSSSIGDIRAMAFAATLDTSLGQGPLQIFTPTTAFSNNAPVDRTTWQKITNPIQTQSLINNGATGQYSTNLANGDIIFRSPDGFRSLILARRNFDVWGNVPQSREVQPILNADDQTLLNFGSGVVFNNRRLSACNPLSSPNGVYHDTTIALNFDGLSSLNSKSPSVYDGLWNSLNVLQYVTGQFNGVQRCFAFVLNTVASPNVIEIWEILLDAVISPDGIVSGVTQDNGVTPIVMDFATGDLFDDEAGSRNKTRFDYCRLDNGEISVDAVVGPVGFKVYYRPDQYRDWTLWHEWSVGGASNFYNRMGLGTPSTDDADPVHEKYLREGFTFQIRVVITGYCRLISAKFVAVPLEQSEYAPLINSSTP